MKYALIHLLLLNCIAAEETRIVTMEQLAKEQVEAQKPIAAEIALILPKAKPIELISLQPGQPVDDKGQPTPAPMRYGFVLLGTAFLKNTEKARTLAVAIHDGILGSNGEQAMCFDPRHALRFQDGKEYVDIVLCFACTQGYIERQGQQQWFTITKKPEAIFDAIFSAHGLPKAP